MNEQSQINSKAKKSFYQKWWFWVIVGILVLGVIGMFSEDETEIEPISTDSVQVEDTAKDTVANTETNEEDFKLACQTYTYKELARNPENYEGEKIELRGEVVQVLESGKEVELRVNMNSEYDQTVYVLYTLNNNEGRILEEDIVKIYGTFEGLITYTTVLGAEKTLPRIDAKYIEIIE